VYTKPSGVCDLERVLHTTPKHTKQMEGGKDSYTWRKREGFIETGEDKDRRKERG